MTSDHFQRRYRLLSEVFSGYVLTASSSPVDISVGGFQCCACKHIDGFGGRLRFVLFCLRKILALKNIDIVVAYDPLLTGVIGYVAKIILNAKLVVELNGVYTSSHVWEGATNKLSPRFRALLFPLLAQFVLSRACGIKLTYPEQLEPFKINRKNKIIRSFSNYTNTELFKNIEERKEILFVGFPFKLKGVDVLIKAFKRISGRHPDWYLKILGWYPDPVELNDEIGGHPRIVYHPPVPSCEMPDHIGRCGFLVLPSRTEAMGRVLLEAMSAGKARIGSRVDGIPTVIADGVDGILVEPSDIDALAEKMETLIVCPEVRYQLGRAGQLRAAREFCWEAYFKHVVDFYDDVKNNERNCIEG